MAGDNNEHIEPNKGDEDKKGNDDKKGDKSNKPAVKMSKNQKLLMNTMAIRWPDGVADENWAGIAERLDMSESAAKQQWNETQEQFKEATKGVAPRPPVVLSRKGKKRDAEASASGSAPASPAPKRKRVATKTGASSPTPASVVAPALSPEEEERERTRRIRANPFSNEGMEDWFSEAYSRLGWEWNDASRREKGLLPPLEEDRSEDEGEPEQDD